MTSATLTDALILAHRYAVALEDAVHAAEQVERYERARLTHAPAYQAALAMLRACEGDALAARLALGDTPPLPAALRLAA